MNWLRVATAVVLTVGTTATVTFAAGSPHSRMEKASYRAFGFSFRYPSAWTRVDACLKAPEMSPVTVVSTKPLKPFCDDTGLGVKQAFPPTGKLGKDGVAMWWSAGFAPAQGRPNRVNTITAPNARIDGHRARIIDPWGSLLRLKQRPRCGATGGRARAIGARIQGSPGGTVLVAAIICGPNYAAGDKLVRRILGSIHFTKR